MKLYLHIGLPKTGSSAIQSHIFANRGWLESRGIYVPRTGYASGFGHAFIVGNMSPAFRRGGEGDAASATGQLQALAEELAAAADQGFERALISWEGLAFIHADAVAVMQRELRGHDICLIAYVRDQVRLYQSSALQRLEDLRDFSAEQYFTQEVIPPGRLDFLDYTRIFSGWCDAFGPSIEIRTRLFERARLPGGNVVLDFLEQLGLTADDSFALDERQVNPSLDARGGALLLLANELGLNYGHLTQLSRTLARVTSRSEGDSGGFLSEEDADHIREHFRDSNQRFFERFRPGNCAPDEGEFPTRPRSAINAEAGTEPNAEINYLRAVHAALCEPELDIWEGGPLRGKKVVRIVRPPCGGWRAPDKQGVWSRGRRSVLAFLLPKTDDHFGPAAVRLTLSGVYFEDNHATCVTGHGISDTLDLRHIQIEIPLTRESREAGIHLDLEHEAPGLAAQSRADAEEWGMAYQLQYISYEFVW